MTFGSGNENLCRTAERRSGDETAERWTGTRPAVKSTRRHPRLGKPASSRDQRCHRPANDKDMNHLDSSTRPIVVAAPPDRCDAVIIGLQSKRFVIVRRDGAKRIWSAKRLCRPVGEFVPGEPVYYGGRRDVIRVIRAY